MLWVGVHIFGGTQLDDVAAVHDSNSVRYGQRFLLVVGDVEGRDTQFTLQQSDFLPHFDAQLGIQVGQGLVHEQQRWFDHQRSGQTYPLLLATRKLRGISLRQMLQLNFTQSLMNARLNFFVLASPGFEAVSDVFKYIQVGKYSVVLKHHTHVSEVGRFFCDVLSIEQDSPCIGMVKPGDGAQQGGLAAS